VEKLSDIVDLSSNEIQLQLQYFSLVHSQKVCLLYQCINLAASPLPEVSSRRLLATREEREDQVSFFVSTFDSAFSCLIMMIGLTKAAAMAGIS
jgi:hypothetical protein